MTSVMNSLVRATCLTLLAAASRNADANGTGVDVSALEGHAIAVLEAANVSGTTPTLDVKLQESDTVGGTYTDIAGAAFTQVTTVAGIQKLALEIQATKKFVRAVVDVGGTSPVYTCGCYLIGQPKY